MEEEKIGIPESITINGVTYTVKDTPELQKFIQSVAKVEKSKLYSQYENLKSQIANLSNVHVTEGMDYDAIVDKLQSILITKEDFKEMLPGMIKEVVQPVLTATEQSRQDELKQYREKLISENISTCIPDLVKGETKEELDNSLQESIRLRAAYPAPVSTNGNNQVSDPLIQKQAQEMVTQATPAKNNTIPSTPFRPSVEASGPDNVKQMSMNEFAKKREQILSQLDAMYGK